MAERSGHLRRLVSATGIYAIAAAAQRGIGFLLIPIYTRVIEPQEYGALELVNSFTSAAFAILMLGLASSINKCFHRDCQSDADRAAVLPTALALALPVLTVGVLVLWLAAGHVSQWLVGSPAAIDLLRLSLASGMVYGVVGLCFASLRAEERPAAFGVLSLVQFVTGLGFNVLFVVGYGMGVRGVLWGNLISNLISLAVALGTTRRSGHFRVERRLVEPMLRFGIYLLPAVMAAWIMDLSDRYFLGAYRDLAEVAVYGVGYKVGMTMEFAIVWPFQLAWPAFSFAISHEAGHRETYARTLTYFVLVAVFATLALGVAARAVLPIVLGPAYVGAAVVVPLVALAYALNGVHYTVSPGVHLAGRTPVLGGLAALAAVVNLALNFLLVPRWGMVGAAWSTVLAFGVLALGTAIVAQRVYPVPLEYGRLAKVAVAGAVVYPLAGALPVGGGPFATLLTTLGATTAAFLVLLLAMGFVSPEERSALLGLVGRKALASS